MKSRLLADIKNKNKKKSKSKSNYLSKKKKKTSHSHSRRRRRSQKKMKSPKDGTTKRKRETNVDLDYEDYDRLPTTTLTDKDIEFISILTEAIKSDPSTSPSHETIILNITKNFLQNYSSSPPNFPSPHHDDDEEISPYEPTLLTYNDITLISLYNIMQRCTDIITAMLPTSTSLSSLEDITHYTTIFNNVDTTIMKVICRRKCNLDLIHDPNTIPKLIQFNFDNIDREHTFYPREIQFPKTPKPWIYCLVWDAPWGNQIPFQRSFFQELPNLHILTINSTLYGESYSIADALSDCPLLTSLTIIPNQLPSPNTAIPSSSKLNTLKCPSSQLSPIPPESLHILNQHLHSLIIQEVNSSLTFLNHLTNLTSLSIMEVDFVLNVNSINALSNLKRLFITFGSLASATSSFSSQLETLQLYSLSNFTFSSDFRNLKTLSISEFIDTPDKTSLQNLTSLKYLSIGFPPGSPHILHKDSLRGLTNLEILCFNIGVDNLDNSLQGLTSLQSLVIDASGYSHSLYPSLQGLTALKEIHLINDDETSEEILYNLPPSISVYWDDAYGDNNVHPSIYHTYGLLHAWNNVS
jgi:hypothetical protein